MKTLSNSQAFQDLFALSICGQNSTYIEIGANHPKKNSNSYMLEIDYKWKGISLELNKSHSHKWETFGKRKRENKIYWTNALEFNYLNALKENNMPTQIGYLSCDIEPPYNTFAALQKVLSYGIEFKCITFEHDFYNYKEKNYNEISREFLESMGYKVAVTDVYWSLPENHFETWYVKNDIDFSPTTFENWKNSI
jgi:hypothetical protein